MNPTVIALPFVAPAAPSDSAQRPAAPEVRPVEAGARTRSRPSQALSQPLREARPDDAFQDRSFERRRSATARHQPPRPQPGGFLAQLLGQGLTADSGQEAGIEAYHLLPDAAARGSEAYRRAGAQPALYSEEPAFYRILA